LPAKLEVNPLQANWRCRMPSTQASWPRGRTGCRSRFRACPGVRPPWSGSPASASTWSPRHDSRRSRRTQEAIRACGSGWGLVTEASPKGL
jgi:hypothetical protein